MSTKKKKQLTLREEAISILENGFSDEEPVLVHLAFLSGSITSHSGNLPSKHNIKYLRNLINTLTGHLAYLKEIKKNP